MRSLRMSASVPRCSAAKVQGVHNKKPLLRRTGTLDSTAGDEWLQQKTGAWDAKRGRSASQSTQPAD